MLGESPPLTYPTGAIVIKDASGIVLGEALRDFDGGSVFEIKVGETTHKAILSNVPTSSRVELFGGNNYVYFLEEDCQGLPFLQSQDVIYWRESRDEYYVANPDVAITSILLGSRKITSHVREGILYSFPCDNLPRVAGTFPAVPFVPPQEILNAVYPISLEQLP